MTGASVFRSRAGEVRLKIAADAIEILKGHAQRDQRASEAGGVLLGRRIWLTHDSVVDSVTVPMRSDTRSRCSFGRRDAGHQAQINSVWRASSGRVGYLGEWHTHPEHYPTPSSVDLADWHRRLRVDTVDAAHVFFVILGTGGFVAWIGNRNDRIIEQMELT